MDIPSAILREALAALLRKYSEAGKNPIRDSTKCGAHARTDAAVASLIHVFRVRLRIAWPRDTSAAVTCRNLSKLLLPSSLKGQNPQASFESWDGWGAGRVFRRGSRKSLVRRRRRLAAPPIGRSDVCSDLCIVVSALTICRAGERIEVPAAGRQDHRSSPRRSPAPMAAETRTRRQWGAHRRNWGSRGSSRGRRHPHGIGPSGQGLSWRPWQASPWWATELDTANYDWIVGLPRHRSDNAWCPRGSAPGGLVILGNRDKLNFYSEKLGSR